MMTPQEQQQFFAELEALGEDQVRLNLAGITYNERKKPFVLEWLRRKERAREDEAAARHDSHMTQQTKVAVWAAVAAGLSAVAAIGACYRMG